MFTNKLTSSTQKIWHMFKNIAHINDSGATGSEIPPPSVASTELDVLSLQKLQTITSKVIEDVVNSGKNNTAALSAFVQHNHKDNVINIVALISNVPNINKILEQKNIPYRFYLMDRAWRYFTYSVNDGVTEIYLSKTF